MMDLICYTIAAETLLEIVVSIYELQIMLYSAQI